MTDNELFLKTLKNIYEELKIQISENPRQDGLNKEIVAMNEKGLEIFEKVLPVIKEIEDIFTLEEEEFIYLIDSLETYTEGFIIDNRNKELMKKQEKELNQLLEILEQFYDDDEEYDEDFDDE